MDAACCPLQGADEGPTCAVQRTVVARRVHQCSECGAPIAIGQRHEVYSGICDRQPFRHRTCLLCVEIRDHFACEGFIFGYLWSDLRENFFPNMKAGGPCMTGLSPEAKARLIDKRMEWYYKNGRELMDKGVVA